MIKDQIKKRGLKLGWVADQLGINRNSFRVYLSNEALMPEDIRVKIKQFLKKYQ